MTTEEYYMTSSACGTYIIQNLITGKLYVGSSVDMLGRVTQQLNCWESSNRELKSDLTKYGFNCFKYMLIKAENPRHLEKILIRCFDGHVPLYNKILYKKYKEIK